MAWIKAQPEGVQQGQAVALERCSDARGADAHVLALQAAIDTPYQVLAQARPLDHVGQGQVAGRPCPSSLARASHIEGCSAPA